jgi:hypothetical protein
MQASLALPEPPQAPSALPLPPRHPARRQNSDACHSILRLPMLLLPPLLTHPMHPRHFVLMEPVLDPGRCRMAVCSALRPPRWPRRDHSIIHWHRQRHHRLLVQLWAWTVQVQVPDRPPPLLYCRRTQDARPSRCHTCTRRWHSHNLFQQLVRPAKASTCLATVRVSEQLRHHGFLICRHQDRGRLRPCGLRA